MPESIGQDVPHDKYQRLIKAAQALPAIRVAIAHPCDDVSLQGAVEAARLRLIEPILVGPVERIRSVAKAAGLEIGRWTSSLRNTATTPPPSLSSW